MLRTICKLRILICAYFLHILMHGQKKDENVFPIDVIQNYILKVNFQTLKSHSKEYTIL